MTGVQSYISYKTFAGYRSTMGREKCVGTCKWRSLRGIFYDYYPRACFGTPAKIAKAGSLQSGIRGPRVRTVTVRKGIMCSDERDPSLFRSPLITESRSCHRSNEDRPNPSLSSNKERLCSCISVSQYAKSKEPTDTSAPTWARQSTALSPAVCTKYVTQDQLSYRINARTLT